MANLYNTTHLVRPKKLFCPFAHYINVDRYVVYVGELHHDDGTLSIVSNGQ